MPPRRRKAPSKKEASPAPKKARTSALEDLYSVCVTEGTLQERQEQIRNANQQGAISNVVWPALLSSTSNDQDWKQACQLWTLLVSESPQVLDECQGDKEIWSHVWETVLWDLPLSDDAVHAVTVALAGDSTVIRETLLPHLSGVVLWHFVPERLRELESRKSAALRRRLSSAPKPERLWVVMWVDKLLALLEKAHSDDDLSQEEWKLLHRSLELLLDLLSSIETRQDLVPYLDAIHFSVRCRLLKGTNKGSQDLRLADQLLRRTEKLIQFPIRSNTKSAMSKADVISMYHERATIFQKLCHRHYPEQLQEAIYAGVGLLCNGTFLPSALSSLTDEQVWDLVYRLRLVSDESRKSDREFCTAVLLHHLTVPPFDELASYPLYPTERVLWNPSVIPPGRFPESSTVLSLPKLQTQFLSYRDYLLRNFELTRLESAYEIRSDLVNAVKRVQPVEVRRETDELEQVVETEFRGWARMALELAEPVRIVKVAPPKLGQGHPAEVIAEIAIDLVHCGHAIRREWDALGEFDNLVLVGIDASQMTGEPVRADGRILKVVLQSTSASHIAMFLCVGSSSRRHGTTYFG